MAENRDTYKTGELPSNTLTELKRLVWGADLRVEVFQRWSQGFTYSEYEPTALEQLEGGPCAIIAPVQAFVLKNAIFNGHNGEWRRAQEEDSEKYLICALRDVLCQCSNNRFVFAFTEPRMPNESDSGGQVGESAVQTGLPEVSEDRDDKTEEAYFHSNIRLAEVESSEELDNLLKGKINYLKDPFGVILFLYSVLLTKGIDHVKNEMEDPSEPLIDGTHGHGSQSLINLVLTGNAVSNVWDNDKDVSGLKLRGISHQPLVGFLTLLEHLRYCEVGWFFKCPQFPVWVLGSETHLTVLFSMEKSLCTPETPQAAARRIFKSFDPEGNNFISAILLEDVLKTLDLFADAEYVEMMKRKLDSEGLGIILLNAFMEEFFPDEQSSLPETFVLYHYNGLKRSCPGQKVVYQEGKAMLMDFEVRLYSGNTPILTCLQTKWPGLEIEWAAKTVPSLN